MTPYALAFYGILVREVLRFVHQRGRFFAALVRPLVWLFIFAAGFRSILGVSIQPPYQTYVLYEVYITPGRWYLLSAKLLAAVMVACLQVYVFLAIAWYWRGEPPLLGYLMVLPALLLSGMLLGALGLLLSSLIRQLENFAGVMNFVIFPMFFASSALYPLWRIRESSLVLYQIASANPVTHAVELIRFALYAELNAPAAAWTLGWTLLFLAIAFWGYNPAKGFMARTGKAG